MTTQLILANGFGIGLASDDAVTSWGWQDRRRFETSEKINPLDDPHRMAVLHHGDTHLLGMPVGVLLDEWKASLGSRLQSVEGYRDNFLSWIDDNLDNWSSVPDREKRAHQSLDQRLCSLWRSIRDDLQTVPNGEHHETALTIIRETNEMLDSWDINDPRLHDMAEGILARWGEEREGGLPSLAARIEYWFDDVPRSAEIDREINRFIRLSVEGGYEFPSEAYTTLTFVGYGQKEMFPSTASVVLFGAVQSHVARNVWKPEIAQSYGPSCAMIIPLGRRDVIDQILTGINSPLTQQATDTTIERLRKATDKPAENQEDQDPPANVAEDFTETLRDDLMTDLVQASREDYLNPAHRTVAGMPLESLAETAGALVAVQNLGQDMQGELLTVGGNIDIGTVTLSGGFSWVNHKGRTQNPFL